MRAVDIIMKKRTGLELMRDEISFIIHGYVTGEIPEYQVSALLMAIYFRGMTPRETADLTELMLRSGEVMDLSGIAGPFVDKHSTGGVGDKVSLILAPLAAACGVRVPMMSGRALGHTGGTLDKLESIPGYRTGLSQAEFRAGIVADGFAMTGQTATVVPADKKMYALRDVTATVESIPLITASILAKKVAEGADSLVFDIKSGSGAFMKSLDDARSLARSLVDTGSAMDKRIIGVITDMSEPLGHMVGNFFEVEESIDCLEGHGPADLMELVYRLTAWMLVAAGKKPDLDSALLACRTGIESGAALKLFQNNVMRQGGDFARIMRLRGRYRSAYAFGLSSPDDGYIQSIDAFVIGLAGVTLGVGRNTTADPVHPDVGFIFDKKVGDRVSRGERMVTVYGKNEASLAAVRARVEKAIAVGPSPVVKKPLVIEEILSR